MTQRFNDRFNIMNKIKQTIGIICSALLIGMAAAGQDIPSDRVSVPFRDPSRPGQVKVNLMAGGITVKGYDGKEVVVEARLRGTKPSKNEDKKTERSEERRVGKECRSRWS